MNRLSSPVESMKDHYTVVVVGSGYGGGIAASRLARAGQSVCLLERGREIRPGEYPETVPEASAETQLDTPDGRIGSRLGMFDFHVNPNQDVLVGCGLGGTSLINANVALRAVPEVWADARWPAAIRADLTTRLEEGYRRAEAMLTPRPYPETYPKLAKLEALRTSAEGLGDGDRFYRPPINVTFEDGPNAAGVAQKACINCGDCVGGCNHWAKNTTLMNYLPDAHRHGAEIFTCCSVRHLERRDGRWVVRYELLGAGRARFDAPDLFVTADLVVLSAGTLGSSEILLRSKANGLALSDQVGEHFSGNGDVLAFAYDCKPAIHGIGFGRKRRGEVPDVGPCITGIIDKRDVEPAELGFVVEEGSIPGAIGPLMPAAFTAVARGVGVDEVHGEAARLHQEGRAAESWVEGPYRGAIDHTQTYLVMSHDHDTGRLRLERDRLRVDWPSVGKEEVFRRVNDYLARSTVPLEGDFVKDPIWTKDVDLSVISVHPLGGCRMAESAETGTVDDRGRVFSGTSGGAVHDGLYVTDGSVIPLSLGVNPLLTISAISERNVKLLAEERGWTVDYAALPPLGDEETAAPEPLGLRFTETMKGFVSTAPGLGREDYQAGFDRGRADGAAMAFTLTVETDDLGALIDRPDHPAVMDGTVTCPALSAEPMDVHDGRFELFVDDPAEVDVRKMVYRMRLETEAGECLFFHGFKKVDDTSLLHAWPQTTTLYVTVTRDGFDGPLAAVGILHIHAADFARQMTTMRVTGGASALDRLRGAGRFGGYFAGTLWRAYGGVLSEEPYFDPDAEPRKKRLLRAPAPELHPFSTSDGVELLLTRYRGGAKGPVLLVHGAGVSSRIFSTDLPDTNLVEYLVAHGYDVWTFDFRASVLLPASQAQSTGDQVARIDHPEAVAHVLRETGAESVQALVHCYGSNTFFMALLAGLEGVRSVVCSQVATDLICPPLLKAKTGLHVPGVLERLGVRHMTADVESTTATWRDRLYDTLLRAVPVPAGESCRSPVCHRITFLYSLLYQHEQLDERIHSHLHELFGVGNITTFEHLAEMVRHKVVVTADGEDAYLPHLDRLRMPIRFVHGAENRCYLPVSTEKTLERLQAANPGGRYDRKVVPGYGHIDCIFGKHASRDVYPLMLEHLEATL